LSVDSYSLMSDPYETLTPNAQVSSFKLWTRQGALARFRGLLSFVLSCLRQRRAVAEIRPGHSGAGVPHALLVTSDAPLSESQMR